MSVRALFIVWNILLVTGWVQEGWGQDASTSFSPITCNYSEADPTVVFQDIERQSGVIFSYGTINRTITINAKAATIEEVIAKLEEELGTNIILRGKYVIIKPIPAHWSKLFNGKILDMHTNNPVKEASIYNENIKYLTHTNDDGSFSFSLPHTTTSTKLTIAKESYLDTTVYLTIGKNQNLTIYLKQIPKPIIESPYDISIKSPSLLEKDTTLPNYPNQKIWSKIEDKNSSLKNISETFIKTFSFSLIPPICTNRLLAFNTKNAFSLNVIGGYSKGIDVMEIGGVYNLDYGDVKYLQAGGVANIVRNDVTGLQLGGVFNLVGERVDGVQVGGVFNNTSSFNGMQISGVVNNNIDTLKGVQVSGVFQKTRHLKGVQIGGVYNHANHVKGVQISGVVNHADTLKGVQIGLVNIAQSSEGGVPIGLINYVRNGYHKLSISYDELGFVNLGYGGGNAKLHTFFDIGWNSNTLNTTLLRSKIGFQSSIELGKGFYFDTELATGYLYNTEEWNDMQYNMNNHLMVGLSFQITPKLGIRTGLTLNHALYQPNKSYHDDFVSLIPKPIESIQEGSWENQFWIGYKVGVLLF